MRSKHIQLLNCAQKQVYKISNILEYFNKSLTILNPLVESCNLFSTLDGVKSLLASEINDKRLDVQIKVDTEISHFVDRQSLEHVFFNILENAIEASYYNDEVHVTANELTNKNSNFLVILVKDNGAHISKDTIRRYLHP